MNRREGVPVRRRRLKVCRQSAPIRRFIGDGAPVIPPAAPSPRAGWRTSFVEFRPRTPCSSGGGRSSSHGGAIQDADEDKWSVQIRPRSPCSSYGGQSPIQRRSMRYHRHVPRCHRSAAARRCRSHRRARPSHRYRDPSGARDRTRRGTSRIAPLAIREARGHEGAAQGANLVRREDPDCWGRSVVILLRLIGGGRW